MVTEASSATSGLDVPTLVSSLMKIERQPIDKLEAKVKDFEARISSYGTLKGLISDFQSAVKKLGTALDSFSAKSSNDAFFTATAKSSATEGSYTLEVSQLARAQSLVAAGQGSISSAIGTGATTTVTFEFGKIDISASNSHGGGSLSAAGVYTNADFTGSGTSRSIQINSSNNSLQGIRDAINNADLGVTASIVNDGGASPYRLAIVSKQTGEERSLKISTDGGDASIDALLSHNPAGTQNLQQTAAAQNANFKLNGIAISKSSNVVSDAIDGVTLTLKKPTEQSETLTVARDNEGFHTAIKGFVDSYNALATQLKSRSAYKTDKSPGGSLAGDRTLHAMQNQLREAFNVSITSGSLTSLAEVGISTQAGGGLQFNSAKFDEAIKTNFSDVSGLLNKSTGFVKKFDEWADNVLKPDGLIKTNTDSYQSVITSYNKKIDSLEIRMDAIKKQYTNTYTNLNVMLISMGKTSAYLSSQLG